MRASRDAAAAAAARRSRSRCNAAPIAASSAVSSSGFSRKSTAPAMKALRAAATSPCAVMMTTGSAMPRSPSIACSSRPPVPGMRRSSSRHPGHSGRTSARKSSAEAKPAAAMPFSCSRSRRDSRTAPSSSTT
jgi:hypothetical protein